MRDDLLKQREILLNDGSQVAGDALPDLLVWLIGKPSKELSTSIPGCASSIEEFKKRTIISLERLFKRRGFCSGCDTFKVAQSGFGQWR